MPGLPRGRLARLGPDLSRDRLHPRVRGGPPRPSGHPDGRREADRLCPRERPASKAPARSVVARRRARAATRGPLARRGARVVRVPGRAPRGETVDEDKATQAVATEVGVAYRKIDPLKLDAQLITRTLSRPFARRHGVLPIERRNGALVVATTNPFDRELFENLRGLTGAEIEPVLSSPSDIHRAIAEVYGFRQQISQARIAARGRERRAGRHEPRAVREPLGDRRARGVLRAGGRRRGVPPPLRLRAARERHPHRAAARGVGHPDADRRGPPPGPPHPEGGARRHREPVQDHEPARHRAEAPAGRAHPDGARRRRDGAARLDHPDRVRRQDRGARARPAGPGARPLGARVPARRARRPSSAGCSGPTAS